MSDATKWQAIRKRVVERDRYNCRICHVGVESRLHVHHIDWDPDNNDDDNLVTLCGGCHRQVHVEGFRPCWVDPDWPMPWGEHPEEWW